MRSAWKFFSSVKLAIVLIILITLASVLGTLIPQGRSAAEYSARYGSLDRLDHGCSLGNCCKRRRRVSTAEPKWFNHWPESENAKD